MPKKLTTKEFIKKAENRHNFWYDYSKAIYINSRTKIEIICSIHGSFWQLPSNHLQEHGCPKCDKSKKDDIDSFIKKAKNKHSDYDYSKSIYIDAHTKVEIICPIHGSFWQRPGEHLYGYGCSGCSGNKKSNTEEFTKKAENVHDYLYDYSRSVYVNNKIKIEIVCPIHGSFWQIPNNHLNKAGCPKCRQMNTSFNFVKLYKRSPLGQKTGIFYKLLFTHTESEIQFVKIGITRKTIEKRYEYGYVDFQYKIIDQIKDINLNCALMEELYIKENKENKFQLPETWEFDGRTECFNFDKEKLKFKEVRL